MGKQQVIGRRIGHRRGSRSFGKVTRYLRNHRCATSAWNAYGCANPIPLCQVPQLCPPVTSYQLLQCNATYPDSNIHGVSFMSAIPTTHLAILSFQLMLSKQSDRFIPVQYSSQQAPCATLHFAFQSSQVLPNSIQVQCANER
jgi:hypothetical protein